MKCLTENKIYAYLDNELSEIDEKKVNRHLESCKECQQRLELYLKELRQFDEIQDVPLEMPLPQDFTHEVMSVISPQQSVAVISTSKKGISRVMSKFTLAAAGILLAMTVGSYYSPTLAAYVKSIFQLDNTVDQGLQTAAEKGFASPLNLSVTDQGITLEVKEVLADSQRIAVLYRFVKADGTIIPMEEVEQTEEAMKNGDNEPTKGKPYSNYYVAEESGKMIRDYYEWGWSFQKYGSYTMVQCAFNDGEQKVKVVPPNNLVFHIDYPEVGKTKGSWKLAISIDLAKSKAATSVVKLNKQFDSDVGIQVIPKEIEFAPSATSIILEINETEDRLKKRRELFRKYNLPSEYKQGGKS